MPENFETEQFEDKIELRGDKMCKKTKVLGFTLQFFHFFSPAFGRLKKIDLVRSHSYPD